MKNFKSVFAVVMLVITLASCTKQASDKSQLAPERMTLAEVREKLKIELPDVDYDGTARGRKQSASLSVNVWFNDLSLSNSAGVLTTSISPDAEWGGVQKFFTIDTTNNGVSVCNWNWSGTTAPSSQTCQSNGPGSYRSWTSDKVTYDIHVSSFLPVE